MKVKKADADRIQALKAERDKFASLAFCWADLLFELDADLVIRFVAGAAEAFVGSDPESLIGKPFSTIVLPEDANPVEQALASTLRTGRIGEEHLRLHGPGGFPLRAVLSAYCLNPVRGDIYVGVKKALFLPPEPAQAAGGTDDAAGFAERAATELKKRQALGENTELALVSIPEFAELKSRLSGPAHRELDSSVDAVLRAGSMGGNTVNKMGEGRFSLVCAEGANLDDIVGRIEGLTRSMDPSGEGAKVLSSSAAIAVDDSVTGEDLAKSLLYTMNHFRGEDGGAASIRSFADNMPVLLDEAVGKVNEFKQMVARGSFSVALQPIVHIDTGDIHHYEALCRFDSDGGGSPFKTITFAEEVGLIDVFDLAMARKVIEWLNRFPRNNNRYRVAVNVSGFSIGKASYLSGLLDLLRDNPWTQGKLMFEITESSRMSDLESANRFIQALRARRYSVCLDDFGAGAVSFQYLSVLDVDVVKLDGSAIRNAQRAPKGRAFLSSLTELCRRMDVQTVAEMIDTPETLEFCRDCGCNYVQGYLFGRPALDLKAFDPLPNSVLFKHLTGARG
ncbi:MAG: EAL domain-containing protein [Rhodospirillaceae bacterium]|nr:EAL domain-containing protein [Rhodospirillaceae bacterium]